jgi:predicted AAA+ superfamily ATPase
MYRETIKQLVAWKGRQDRMPLLVTGARQVGKTWLIKRFGQEHYANIAYLSFDSSPALAKTLERTVSPRDLIPVLSAETGVAVKPDSTLIVFDEIQDAPRALLALKYFQEEAPEYHIVAAGSTLGVMLHRHASFPVGKVEFCDLFPLTFNEFLRAIGEEQLAEYVRTSSLEGLRPFHDKLIGILREYLYVGGMPAVVDGYAANRGDYELARSRQKTILRAYDQDFSKYTSPLFASKLRADMMFPSMPPADWVGCSGWKTETSPHDAL